MFNILFANKENLVKEMAIRRINKTLSGLLTMLILTAFVSYYFAMTNEVTLNKLRRQITTLNEENSELQNQLDRLKSFNNVDDGYTISGVLLITFNPLDKVCIIV